MGLNKLVTGRAGDRGALPRLPQNTDRVLFTAFLLLGGIASYINVNIPHTPTYFEVRWAFGFMGFVLLRRWRLAFLLACLLSVAGPHSVPWYICFFGNMLYAFPELLLMRWLHSRFLVRIPHVALYCACWFILVLLCYQVFNTPLVWAVVALVEGKAVLPFVVSGWTDQPYLLVSVLVGIGSALGLAVFRAHTALRQSRRETEITLHSIGDAVITTDANGRITRMNPVAETLTGWKQSEARGRKLKAVFNIFDTRTGEAAEDPVEKALRRGVITGLANHTCLIARGGTRYQIADSAAPIRDDSDQIIGVVMVFRDVTEDYRRREELQRATDVIRRSPAAAFVWRNEADWPVEHASGNVSGIFGCCPSDFLRGRIRYEDVIHPDDRARVAAEVSAASGDTSAMAVRHKPYRVVHRDGGVKWLDARVSVRRGEDGRAEVFEGVLLDITERKTLETALAESQRRYREIFEGSRDGFVIVSADGRITDANPAYCGMLGYSLDELRAMKNFYRITPERWHEWERSEIWEKRLLGQGYSGIYEKEYIGKDGRVFPIELQSYTVTDTEGTIRYLWGIVRDITERRNTEAALRRHEAMLARTESIAHVGSWEWDIASDTVTWSKELFRIFKRDPALGAPSFKEHDQLYLAEDMAQLREAAASAVHEGEPYEISLRAVCSDGEIRHCLARGYPESDEKGKPIRLYGALQDITELKTVEEHYTRLCLMARELICIADLTTATFLQVNPAFEKVLGYSETALLERPFLDFVHPDDVERTVRIIKEELLQGREIIFFENRYRCRDGSYRILQWNSHPNLEEQKTYAIAHDVTEMRKAEGAVRKSEELYRSLAENFPNGALFLYDANLRYLAADGRALRAAGLSRDLIVGRYIWEVFPEIWEEIKPYAEAAVQGKEACYEVEYRGRLYSNQALPVYGADDTGHRAIVIVQDITEQKMAGEELRRLAAAIEQSGEIIVITDTTPEILYVNPAFEAVTGYSRKEAIGKNPAILKSGQQDTAFYAAMWADLTAGRQWQGRFVNRRKDGTLYTEEATISPVFDAAGKLLNYAAVKRDITRELELEQQYRQSQKMEAIGQLTGGVAHDFNNLLQVINGGAELAMDDLEESHPARESLADVIRAGDRAASLVGQLLAFSRRQIMHPLVLDLNMIIDDLIKMLRRVIGEDIRLEWIPGRHPGSIRADRGMIEQVLMNLCVNARDAMPEGGTLSIETQNVLIDSTYCATHTWASPGRYIVLTVSDTGCGMDRETVERIFEPFFTTKGEGRGTGLGLATVYGIVKQHEGMISAYSEPGKGTIFKIYLPVCERKAETVGAAIEGNIRGGTETILIAEDDPAVAKLGRRILERAGYTVLSAANGREALTLFRQHLREIDFALLDVVMPEMGGYECCRAMRDLQPGTKVLFASGYSENAAHTSFIVREGIQLIQKPYAPDTLLRAVRAVLDET
jgi:two-component system, cell cycle sensor histidine kinase and response regulator CckA